MEKKEHYFKLNSRTVFTIVFPLIMSMLFLFICALFYFPIDIDEIFRGTSGLGFTIIFIFGWFYVSVLAGGFSALYSNRQFLTFIAYLVALFSFGAISSSQGNILAGLLVYYIFIYAISWFILQFLTLFEARKHNLVPLPFKELSYLLLPVFMSAVYIITSFLLQNRAFNTADIYLIIGGALLATSYGIFMGYVNKLPYTASIITILSILSIGIVKAEGFTAFQTYTIVSSVLYLVASFGIPFIIRRLK
ncbi:MAG: hypothetical protein ACRDAO_03630 [Culicoidibacterales bacterium]